MTKIGDRCSAEFFKFICQKNAQAIIMKLKDNQGRNFIPNEGDKADLNYGGRLPYLR